MRYKKLPFDQEMVESSIKKAKNLGAINNSILKGVGNRAGYLGEEALAKYINADIVSSDRGPDKYNHDLLLKTGQRIEVKTKRRTVGPHKSHDVSIAASSSHQRPDIYAFISLEFARKKKKKNRWRYGSLKNIWLYGFMPADEFWEKAEIWEAGDFDSSNSFTTHVDMYNMNIEDLYDDLSDIIEKGK